MVNLLEELTKDYKPQLFDIIKYGQACGLEGEHQTLVAGAIAFHGGDLCVLVTGASQAGKTHVSKIIMSMMVPRTDGVDEIVDNRELLLREGGILGLEFGSATAIAYSEQKLQEARQIYLPEYQKAIDAGNKLMLEVLKAFGENRSAYRDVTEVSKKEVRQQEMKRSNWWACIATENPLKIDVETGNRVLPLSVDVSAEQTRRIMLHKARKEFVAGRQVKMLPDEALQFKHFMRKYRDAKDIIFENPFAEYIAANYLPSKYIKSRRAIDFYLAFNKAVAKWHYLNGNRMIVDDHVLLNIEDIYQTEEIYGTRCRFDMLQLDPNSMQIFDVFSRLQKETNKDNLLYHTDGRVMLDVSQIHKELASKGGINLKINVVEQMLDELQECGYLEYSTGVKERRCRYLLVDVDKPINSIVDYGTILSHGTRLVREWLPEAAKEWESIQKSKVHSPFTGELVDLFNATPVPTSKPIVSRQESEGLEKYLNTQIKWS